MFRVLSRYHPHFGYYFVVQQREAGYWITVRHPQGKVMRTREHAENFLRIKKYGKPSCCGCGGYCGG